MTDLAVEGNFVVVTLVVVFVEAVALVASFDLVVDLFADLFVDLLEHFVEELLAVVVD